MKRFPDPALRILILFVLVFGGLLYGRFWLIPAPIVNKHMQKETATAYEKAKPVSFAGASACAECHEDEFMTKQSGYHRNLSCEVCHGPAFAHTEDPDSVKPHIPKGRDMCPICHTFDLARPTGFPQIEPMLHNPLEPCVKCHNPHDPKPPHTPTGCGSCHGQIARTKAVSPHARLECTTCHDAPEEHRVSPREVLVKKPETREFCGKCHGEDSEEKGVPKVDIQTHGQKYLCWQCHYPHMPEVTQ